MMNNPSQEAIRAKCFHPSGDFIEFKKEEIEQSIPDRFEKVVRSYSHRTAVKTRNHALTYDALNKMANRLGRAILAQRGEVNEPIALLLDNDVSMIVATLSVLKAGKFYVPLDCSFPQTRLLTLIEDSQAALILTNTKNRPLAETLRRTENHIVNMDEPNSYPDDDIAIAISPDRLSSLRYTSGSTGEPKGVLENHRALLHHVMNNTNSFHICADDRINAGNRDFHNALLNGASLYVHDIKQEGLAHLTNWFLQNEITISRFVPTVFRHFLDTFTGGEVFPSLRLITVGGEPVSKRDVELYKRHFPPECILVNRLGSREIGNICQYFMDSKTEIEGATVPVGYAVDGKEILLLDDAGKEVGAGETGQIAVRSRYLSPGYWRRPDLTQAAFLPDPNGGDERIYLTGDLGRVSADGGLEYIGRKDLQAKVRGNKVEPTEIETMLLDLDAIKEAAVLALEDKAGDHRLVAYLVPAKRPVPTVGALRSFLKEKLPDYMIPSAFVVMDALPLLSTGKVDRRALPTPSRGRPELDVPFASPRTPVEEVLQSIWIEVLGLDQVGIHDNFLDLGGQSLMATRIISRVIDRFRVDLPVKSLLEAPSVAEMAIVITQNQAKRASEEDLATMLEELERLSNEEVQRLLGDKEGSPR